MTDAAAVTHNGHTRHAELRPLLAEIARRYPSVLRDPACGHPDLVLYDLDLYVERTAFDMGLILDRTSRLGTVVDVGGGFGLFSLGFAALGYKAVLVDDFWIHKNYDGGQDVLRLFHEYGVELEDRDAVAQGVDFEDGSLLAVSSFHMLEHLHNSPKALFHQMSDALAPGGVFVLGGPNCVNLRKRLTMLGGKGKWTRMDEWYEQPVFRGHVREPHVDDLRYIADDLGLSEAEILGRNFLGLRAHKRWIRTSTRLADRPLRLRPSLCSDIYLVGVR